jgi:sensor histidine kinase YesM
MLWLVTLAHAAHSKGYYFDSMKLAPPATVHCAATKQDDESWQTIKIHELKQSQRVCLRQTITIDPAQLPTHPAIVIYMLAARKVYWDGQLLGADGKPGDDKNSEIPGQIHSHYLIPQNRLNTGKHVLSIEASMFHINEPITTLFYSLSISDYERALTNPILSSGLAVFLMGALVLISVFFQMIFWLYQRRTSYQIFSLMCLSSACLLLAEKYRYIFGYTYDWHMVRSHWLMFFTYLSMLALPCFYLFHFNFKRRLYWFVVMPFYQIYSFVEQGNAMMYVFIIFTIMTALIGEMNRNRLGALTSARLEADLLKRNLQPHFLMNSLMLIIEWIEHKPKAAVQFVESLSEELRMLIQFSSKKEVALSEEIALCTRHLEIMAHRYNTDYQLIVEGDVEGLTIPPAIIHTQIENAFSHNRIVGGSVLVLSAKREDSEVVLQLKSPLKKKPTNNKPSTGTGEKYILARLKERFGQHFDYQSYAEQDNWVNTVRYHPNKAQD